MRVKIGSLVVPLDQCVLQVGTKTGGELGIMVIYHTQILRTFFENDQPDEYRALKTYMDAHMDLSQYNLNQIKNEAFDPFLNGEPDALYNILQSLPNVDDLVLGLEKDGAGMLWVKDADGLPAYVECEWQRFDEGLEKLQAYKQSKQDSAAGKE